MIEAGSDYPCHTMQGQEVITHVPSRAKMNMTKNYFMEVKFWTDWISGDYPYFINYVPT